MYQRDCPESSWIKLFFGLQFLDPSEVEEAFSELIEIAPANENLLKFSDYVLENYIEPCSLFPSEIWAQAPSHEPRTNNGAEAFHRHLNENFYTSQPNIHICIDVLRKVQAETYLKLRTFTRRKTKLTEKEISLQKTYADYTTGKISLLEALQKASFKFLPIPIKNL